ncbi:hypothetical protein MCHLDSM_01695 [Mycolicibacterium chlorophenolicum]|uniref:Uncharacterized protein n=1 Tax=Mycolicibacterium chlorophenolicum TaxID=37916 RepID=A0A0J6WAT5_9MYCO|nr:hypothetical protein MCHLDSM_01695 [Mycolicibacterium chlorophenolicum]
MAKNRSVAAAIAAIEQGSWTAVSYPGAVRDPDTGDWILCPSIAHNLLRAIGVLTGGAHAVARGATLRRRIVNIPARLARPQRRPVLHLPSHWPWA